jgi:hypothetical protein
MKAATVNGRPGDTVECGEVAFGADIGDLLE